MTREVQALMQFGEQRLAEMLLEARDEITELRGAARPNHWDKTLGWKEPTAEFGPRDVLRRAATYLAQQNALKVSLGIPTLAQQELSQQQRADHCLATLLHCGHGSETAWLSICHYAVAAIEALHSAEVARIETGEAA